MRKLNWREIIGVRGVYGTISDANRGINASGLQYMAPENVYWEYSAGIGNIFKVFRIDFAWRKLFKHTRYAAILSKIFWILFLGASSCTLYFMPNLGIKDVVPIWAKKSVHESY
jgi:hypothetical protein